MADRYVLVLKTALASNTGGPYTARWDRAIVPSTGTIRSAWAVAQSLTSNVRENTVDIYVQADAPAAGSNTATTILVSPITLSNNLAQGQGSIRESAARISAGDSLELRTYADTAGSQPAFVGLTATVEIEREV